MTRITRLVAAIAITAAVAPTAHAGSDYRCTIERVYDAEGERSTIIDGMRKAFVGKEFTVDRRTGLMVGALKNSFLTDPVVVDPGSTENSFKVANTMRRDQGLGSGSTLSALVVKEYVDSPAKPFSFLLDGTVYFGRCIHF